MEPSLFVIPISPSIFITAAEAEASGGLSDEFGLASCSLVLYPSPWKTALEESLLTSIWSTAQASGDCLCSPSESIITLWAEISHCHPCSRSLLYGSELKDSFISVRSPHLRMKPAELAHEQTVSWSYHYECKHLIRSMLLTHFSSICVSWLCNSRLTEMRLGYN